MRFFRPPSRLSSTAHLDGKGIGRRVNVMVTNIVSSLGLGCLADAAGKKGADRRRYDDMVAELTAGRDNNEFLEEELWQHKHNWT
jgi:hypothetical protein